MASWVKDYDPDLVSQRLENVKTISGEGKVSFSGFEHSEKKGSGLPLTLINAVLYFSYLSFNFSVIFFELRNSS